MNLVAGTVSLLDPYESLIKLFNREQNILEMLQEQIQHEESGLNILQSHFHELSATVTNRSHKEKYLSNPLNTLTLVRRLTTVWTVLINVASDSSILSLTDVNWLSDKDLQDAARALTRLQLTYNLITEDLANGKMYNVSTNVNITAADCVNIARQFYQQHEYSQAAQWLDQALTKHDNTIPAATVLELAILSKCFSGDSVGSVSALKTLLKDFPNHEPSPSLLSDWELAAFDDCPGMKLLMEEKRQNVSFVKPKLFEHYNWLCRGGSSSQPGLRCRYVHYNKTYLRLAPFLMEELQLDPPVLIFHNVLSDVEIQELKRVGLPKLHISTVGTYPNVRISYYRTSEISWIPLGESPIIDIITKRMTDMTTLDMKVSDRNQVSRYGLGGEYLIHIDALGAETRGKGNRISTLMFYLNDVPRGGHTVFTKWHLSVQPQKGSAIFWFNLHRNGTVDDSSEHAGCSVLEGVKWVMNKWFYELGSDSTTSCLLDPKASFKYFYI